MNNISPVENRATRPFIDSDSEHEMQPQQAVSASRTTQAVVSNLSERATIWSCRPQLQQLRQQQAERELQLQRVQSLRNGSPRGFNPSRKTHSNLFPKLCEYENLLIAFSKAKKRKSKKVYVQQFEENLSEELGKLQWELLTNTYSPRPLTTFTIRDPKTRKISASDFRDRVVHHAICNLLEPIFERRFIYDTFANRTKKGTIAILRRFDIFRRKFKNGFALKADIKHYFDTVEHKTLIKILKKRVKDTKLIELIQLILNNHNTKTDGKGMPLGNLTSQFFANIYLGELDKFIKHGLRAKYYARYVDDFILLSKDKKELEEWQSKIDIFLKEKLQLTLHPAKTKIVNLNSGVSLVGFRVFKHHKLLKKSNIRRLHSRLRNFRIKLAKQQTTPERIKLSIAGWNGYAQMGNTYRLRKEINNQVKNIVKGDNLCQKAS